MRGLLVGTAVGDALGLPMEGLAPGRAARIFPPPWRHRLLPGRGMTSDDTEHTIFVAQSLLSQPASAERFARRLAWCLRGWLLGLPAGIGLATLRATVRLWLGVPPHRSGVYSAGNGPAMRVAPIGALFAGDPAKRLRYVSTSTQLTHTDPRATVGARAIAEIAAWCFNVEDGEAPSPESFVALLRTCGPDDAEWQDIVDLTQAAIEADASVLEFARSLRKEAANEARYGGVTGYVYETVPVAAYAWLRHFGSFEATLQAVLECGGDSDTVGAITGAIAGAAVGEAAIPAAWVAGIADWPRGVSLLRRLGDRLAELEPAGGLPAAPVRYFWPALALRNAFFLVVVLAHGLRRLAPPY